MRFAHPPMIWLMLATTGLLAAFLVWAWRKKQRLITHFVQARLLPLLSVNVSRTREGIRMALVVAAVGLGFLALARPQWGFEWEEARQRGLDIVVAIDTSRSMLARDVQPNRLTRAKLVALDLLRKSRRDRLGLVAFAGTAFLQCPLTLDDEAFRQSVEALDVAIIPQGGTALTEAITTALTAFKSEGENFKILVLISDGEDHDSGALAAAGRASSVGLKIFTLGVGTENGDVLQETDEKGATVNIKGPDGSVVKSRLNEALLQQLASASGGFYLPLRAPNAIDTLYEKGLAPLPKADLTSKLIRRYHERYYWPLAASILLLLAEWLLPHGRPPRRRDPQRSPPIAAPPVTAAVPLVVGALLAVPLRADPALRQYEAGHYEQARQTYEKRLQSSPADPRLHYNLGAVAFRRGEYEKAAQAFGKVLTAPDLALQQRAYYNLGDTLYRLGEQSADTPGTLAHWQNSVKQFESALKLAPHDADAKHNLEFVRKKLEELKQQQEPQPSPDQDKPKPSEPNPDPDPGSPSPDPNQPTPPEPSKNGDPQPDQPSPGDAGKEGSPDPQKPPDSQDPSPREPEDPTSTPSAKPDQDPGSDSREAAVQPPPAPGEMTLQQAEQLLDSQKGDERALIFIPPRKAEDAGKPLKDW